MIKDKIKILFTGDLCPHERIEKLAVEKQYDEIFNDFIDVFQGNDLNVTDLECPLTELTSGRPKTGPHQKALPQTVGLLKFANIGLAAMANNHMMDFGAKGAMQTIDLLKNSGINTIGLGDNAEKARKYYTLKAKGKHIAILNFADNEFLTAPGSTVQCNPIDLIHNFEDILKAKKDHDVVILCVHGGNEFYHLPSPRIKELYRHYINIGADAIISHHTHTYSGYEIYNKKPIFYGLGNFIYDWSDKTNTPWNQGYVVRLNISEKIDFDIIPLKQCNEQPGVFHLNEAERQSFLQRMNELNSIIADDKLLETEFQKYCEQVLPMYDAFIEPYFGKIITSLRKRGLFPKLMGRRKRLLLLNITRCESHKEVLHYLLKKNE
jgi:poly-gamma-glutamate synthesis protein (capsule biosynthesis protein)